MINNWMHMMVINIVCVFDIFCQINLMLNITVHFPQIVTIIEWDENVIL